MKKIVIVGPESTGKSSLCQALAEHFNCPWVPEYAREFLHENGTDYSFEDLLTIATNQLKDEDRIVADNQNAPFVFIDTDMQVMHVWSTVVFDKQHAFIEAERAKRHYDLYLLACPDLPWVADEMREYPDLEMRERLHRIYKNILEQLKTPYIEVRGIGDARTQCAIDAINQRFRRPANSI